MKTFPFIYIAGLRRTGTTVLSEALTLPPYSWIFREPQLTNRNIFTAKEQDVQFFLQYEIDLPAFQKNMKGMWYTSGAKYFRDTLLPQLLSVCRQIGVKEIHHQYWKQLLRAFPNMKVILTGRDPRDIYISLYYRNLTRQHPIKLNGPFCPETVAENLLQDFQYQQQMYRTKRLDCLKIRYEDLCTDQATVYTAVKRFVSSPIPTIGKVGRFNSMNLDRIGEYKLHGKIITDKCVYRWRNETDLKILKEAYKMFDLFSEYAEFWGYEKCKSW